MFKKTKNQRNGLFFIQRPCVAKFPVLDRQELRQMYLSNSSELQHFAAEIEKVEMDLQKLQSPEDAKNIEHLLKLSSRLERIGRKRIREATNIHGWLKGVSFLAGHYVMELTNGHALAHGMYDAYSDSRSHLSSNLFDWDMAMHPQLWKYDHIENHHPFTNMAGWDHDLVFFLYRASGKQAWKPHHLFQLPMMLLKPLWVQEFLAFYMAISEAKGKQRPWYQADFETAINRILNTGVPITLMNRARPPIAFGRFLLVTEQLTC